MCGARGRPRRQLERLQQIVQRLQEVGYLRQNGHRVELTPRAIRKLAQQALKEVKRCTQAGITTNTFMLATNHYWVDFIDKMTRINRGRAFYSTSGQLGHYVMVGYLRSRRKRVG